LLSIALTVTYFPPICEMTFAYSFSAPTARMTPGLVPAELAEQAVASRPAAALKAIAVNA
jgi:hypothetical protein